MSPTNVFFNNYKATQEQRLIEDLMIETVKINGFEAYYVPRKNEQYQDIIYGEDPLRKFTESYVVEMYLNNVTEFGGDDAFFSKFGLEIKHEIKLMVSRRMFAKQIPANKYSRPREGDLVYVPFLRGSGELYEIKYVKENPDFYTLGRPNPYFYELSLELFKYSQEKIQTGVEDIDSIAGLDAYSIEFNMGTGTGNYNQFEIVYQGASVTNATSSAIVANWDAPSKVLKVTNLYGTFIDNVPITGNTSNAIYTLANYDDLKDTQIENAFENREIQDEADVFVITSEPNPFGTL